MQSRAHVVHFEQMYKSMMSETPPNNAPQDMGSSFSIVQGQIVGTTHDWVAASI